MGTVPVLVELSNDGPNARGMVRLSAEDFRMDYPVELPRGARKQFIAYPRLGYNGLQASLLTNRGTATLPAWRNGSAVFGGGESMLLIGDSPGEMAFLRSKEQSAGRSGPSVSDAYVKPELAPPRPVGYEGIHAVVLGAGAERMSAEAVRALTLYTLTGGTVVFVGGASSPVLADPRWAPLFPARNLRVRTLLGSARLSKMARVPLRETLSVTTGTPAPGATARKEQGVALTIERPFGLGRAVLLAYNPFEPPLSTWAGRRKAFLVPAGSGKMKGQAYLNSISQEQDASTVSHGGSMPPPPPVGGSPAIPYRQPDDPFNTTLPPASKVFLVLASYFIVVVPLNFLVLRKLRRGELAWLTAPIISLGFAGILFASASGLYSAKLSTATRGVLMVHEGIDEGIFVGRTQMFFPRGGRYDLRLEDVDSLGLANADDFYNGGFSRRNQDTAQLDPIDTGEIEAPAMRASSLAFRQLYFRQKVAAGNWFRVDVGERKGDEVRVTVTNSSPHVLREAGVYVGSRRTPIKDLRPGERASVQALAKQLPPGAVQRYDEYAPAPLPNSPGSVAVMGSLEGFRPGPRIGQEVASRRRVLVAVFDDEGVSR